MSRLSIEWRRSRRCDSNTCVEVASVGGAIAMRDGKEPEGNILIFSRADWTAFVTGVRAGEFDAR
ncbi:protein of unknown function [Micromonospora pattaloongensis]|uniref:DUF397 domain-containing protein n=2 Tax=Micromonospora pattaloongensis TaxID=405436 RepID=A0A1H3KI97_9ACTN|nr:DUF397 domain-containing protein [Micromonospora pattaloongensis]SDY51505.1 protein of unknown function [Micromonospora pattaloongensis]